jgi:integrase
MVTFGRWIKEYLVGLLFYKEFTLLHAKTYIEYLVSKGFKPASIVVKRAALKSFWDYLVLWGEASTNPFDQVCVPNPPSLPKHPFSEKEDVDMLPEFVRAGKWYPAFLIMRFAGLRLSETLALSPADITLSADDLILRIHVRSGNGKERWAAMVPCDNRTTRPYFYQDIVWEAVKARWNDKFLFEAGKGGVFSTYRTMIRKGWLPKGFTPHRLRDTFANWLRMEGCREGTVGALLGHEDILTKMYGSRRPEYVEREFLKQWKALGNLKASWI